MVAPELRDDSWACWACLFPGSQSPSPPATLTGGSVLSRALTWGWSHGQVRALCRGDSNTLNPSDGPGATWLITPEGIYSVSKTFKEKI